MVRQRIVQKEKDERTRGIPGLNQKLESLVDGAKVGGRAAVRRTCTRLSMIMERS